MVWQNQRLEKREAKTLKTGRLKMYIKHHPKKLAENRPNRSPFKKTNRGYEVLLRDSVHKFDETTDRD